MIPGVLLLLLAVPTASTASVPDEPPPRREPQLGFAVDAAFQQAGGVQYFFELTRSASSGSSGTEALRQLLSLDTDGRWNARTEAWHPLVFRVAYTLNKDSRFFTSQRLLDPEYMNAIAHEADIRKLGPGTYHAGKMPANTFEVRVLEHEELRRKSDAPWFKALRALYPEGGEPVVVVVQENYDFARVMGFRTTERSFTYTAHYRLAPGVTRVMVYGLSYLHNIPPVFLGGADRVHAEALKGTLGLIERLRSYPNGRVAAE